MSDNKRQDDIWLNLGGLVKNYAGLAKNGLISTVFRSKCPISTKMML